MPKLLGGLFALVALAVCILNGIEPWTGTVRGMVAFAVGHLAGSLWESFFGKPGGRLITAEELDPKSSDPVEVEVTSPPEAEPAA